MQRTINSKNDKKARKELNDMSGIIKWPEEQTNILHSTRSCGSPTDDT